MPSEELLSPPPFDRASAGKDTTEETLNLLTQTILPRLGAILDQEKVLAACTLIANQIVSPAVRKRTLYDHYMCRLSVGNRLMSFFSMCC